MFVTPSLHICPVLSSIDRIYSPKETGLFWGLPNGEDVTAVRLIQYHFQEFDVMHLSSRNSCLEEMTTRASGNSAR